MRRAYDEIRPLVKVMIVVACLLVLAGGVYMVSMPAAPDPKAAAVAEAIALHASALKAAVEEECVEARTRLNEWRALRAAGNPSPNDTRDARKVLRQFIKSGCLGQG